MKRRILGAAAALALTGALAGATGVVASSAGAEPPAIPGSPRPAGPQSIAVSPVGTYASGVFNQSAAEIVAHDPGTQRLFVVNAAAGIVDVLTIADPTNPTKLFSLETAGLLAADGSLISDDGVANSVAVSNGHVAIAVEADPKTEDGWVVLFTVGGDFVNALRAGALPDMVTFTPDGRSLLVANEGEPAEDYSVDPEGTVSVIDVSGPIADLTQADVRTATFHAWDPDGGKVLHPDVRVFGPVTNPSRPVSENLEPEYIVAEAGSDKAYVILQEANAMAVLDVTTATFTDIIPFGFKDHSLPGNELDASDQDGAINITSWPTNGVYQPDGADLYSFRGASYVVTANEGDSRDWAGYSEESRFRAFSNNRVACPGGPLASWLTANDMTLSQLRDNTNMGRLNITTSKGLGDDGCIDEVFNYGARSFSIWTTTGQQVFDSGADFEQIIAERLPAQLNANHTANGAEPRSDDKGPEPEDVAIGAIAGRTYAFIVLERIGGLMIYDITDPRVPYFVDYVNNRDFTKAPESGDAGDLGAENVVFIPAGESPINGVAMLAVGNEVSGTTTLFRVDKVVPGRGKAGR